MYKNLELKLESGDVLPVRLQIGRYQNTGGIAINILTMESGCPELYTPMTVNLGKVSDYCAYVDTNRTPELVDFIQEYKLATFTYKVETSGYAFYPLFEFDIERLRELYPDEVEHFFTLKSK